MKCCLLVFDLKIISVTIADNVTEPAIAASTMPASAPLLRLEDDLVRITASDTQKNI